jgi:lipoyltransferase 1
MNSRILFKCNLKNLLNYSNVRTKLDLSVIHQVLPRKEGNLALFSLSNDIHYNLALENFIAESINVLNRNVLLLWISEPCIVIGRHQNPWLECNVKEAEANGVKVVRRYSGGGCVFHDLGNLNISFITNKNRYDRKFNLNLIKKSLEKCHFENLEFEISPRHDIFVKLRNSEDSTSYKISGSAARLSQNFAYHHCTLLFNANIDKMRLLKSNLAERIVTKATPSVRSKVINLKPFLNENSNDFNLDKIIIKLCEEYWKNFGEKWSIEHLFNYINPEEDRIANLIQNTVHDLKIWEHLFASTPKFELQIDLDQSQRLNLTISNGLIKDFKIETSNAGDKTPEMQSFKEFLKLLLNAKLDRKTLLDLIEKNTLLDKSYVCVSLFNFINKNIQ